MKPVLVSLFADASWCPRTGAAGWAVWLKSSYQTQKYYGPFKQKMGSSNEAELAAVANGVFLVMRMMENVNRIHIVTDSDHVLRVVSGLIGGKSRRERDLKKYIIGEAKKAGLKMTWKGIKAHSKGKAPRDYVNRWCDLHARREMQKERRKHDRIRTHAGTDELGDRAVGPTEQNPVGTRSYQGDGS